MTGGLITAPQPEAVEAGADVLRDGGNAVDAAVATALVQTAVDPIMCGIAGFGSMQVWMADSGEHRLIEFHGRAPAAVRAGMWQDIILGEAEAGFGFLLAGAVNEIGYQSIPTPLTLRARAVPMTPAVNAGAASASPNRSPLNITISRKPRARPTRTAGPTSSRWTTACASGGPATSGSRTRRSYRG